MSIFKCKMCGGDLDIAAGVRIAECQYCGTKQTLPNLDSERRTNLYDRANHFRRNNEFDKAMGLYEQILAEDSSDAEAYWSLVLCKYGIEYVEDPASRKRVPTVNRTQFTSIFEDADYQSAVAHADASQKMLYEQEAKAIDEIQKGILSISSKEKPFDVFICYKETDNNGRRTPDSVLANELYHELTEEGFHVFFSRITLEDKLGIAYEPYIFAALNSAKVMVVLGTKPEYFNAVWVKNEWSRYLTLIKNGARKLLIPAYKDMDPYDLPEEFSHLQSQDMEKLGFMQDLIRGIKKIVQQEEAVEAVENTAMSRAGSEGNVSPLLERVSIFLQDKEWQNADEYCERVLDLEPRNARAYLGKLMAQLQVCQQSDLANCADPIDNNGNFKKAVQFGDQTLVDELNGYVTHIKERNEANRKAEIYNTAVTYMKIDPSAMRLKSTASMFHSISGYLDADALAEECLKKAEIARKDEIYQNACEEMESSNGYAASYEVAINKFESIINWKDAREKIEECKKIIAEIKAENARKKKRNMTALVLGSILVVAILSLMVIDMISRS